MMTSASNSYAQNGTKNSNTQEKTANDTQIKKERARILANDLYLDDSEIGTSQYENLSDSQMISIELPPLSVLFQNMKRNPTYRQALIKYQQANIEVGKQKRDPLDWITGTANYNYGVISGVTTNSSSSVALVTSTNDNEKAYWNVGVEFSASLADIFNYSANVKSAKLDASYSKAQMEQTELELKQKVIQIYLTIKSQEEQLKVNTEMVNMYAATFKIAEGEFENGEKEAGSLAIIKKDEALAVGVLQRVKTSFISNLMLLELITHTKIH